MEDRIFIGNKSIIVLDGATQADQTVEQTGGWIAEQIGQRFSTLIETNASDVELKELLAQSIADVRDQSGLKTGESPSTTVSVARFSEQRIDLLTLGDSPILTRESEGSPVNVLVDNRLDSSTQHLQKPARSQDNSDAWQSYYADLAELRNQPDGFWIAEADPAAADNALAKSVPRGAAVLLCTDGVSAMIEKYGQLSWSGLFYIAMRSPGYLIGLTKSLESNDADRSKFQRSKVSDDKTLAVVVEGLKQSRPAEGVVSFSPGRLLPKISEKFVEMGTL